MQNLHSGYVHRTRSFQRCFIIPLGCGLLAAMGGVAQAIDHAPGTYNVPFSFADGSSNIFVGGTTITPPTGSSGIALSNGSVTLNATSGAISLTTVGFGIQASGTASNISAIGNFSVSTSGSGFDAVNANGGAQIALNGGAVSYTKNETSGSQSAALSSSGSGSLITATNTAISVANALRSGSTRFSFGVSTQNNGKVIVNGGTITATSSGSIFSRPRSYGVNAGVGEVVLNNVTMNTTGRYGHGVVAAGGIATINGGAITTTSSNAVGLYSTGSGGNSTINAYGTRVTAENSFLGEGVLLETRSGLEGSIVVANLNNVHVSAASNGVHADGANRTINAVSSTIIANGGSAVAYASFGGVINLKGGYDPGSGPLGGTTITGNDVHGVRAFGDGSLVTSDSVASTITTTGDGAFGAYAASGGKVMLNNDNISTGGDSSYGAYATETNSLVSLTGGSITTSNANADGGYARAGGEVRLTNAAVTTNGETSLGAIAISGGALVLDGNEIVTKGESSNGVVLDGPAVRWQPMVSTRSPHKTQPPMALRSPMVPRRHLMPPRLAMPFRVSMCAVREVRCLRHWGRQPARPAQLPLMV